MTLQEFRDLLLTVDPDASHYASPGGLENYTTWSEYGDDALAADNERSETVWNIQVDRFTKIEFDPMVDSIQDLLDGHPDISFTYQVDHEPDTGFIHHIFDCEVA